MFLPLFSQVAMVVKQAGASRGSGQRRDVDGRPGRAPGNAAQRHRAIRGAEILAIGEEMRVRVEIGARRRDRPWRI